MDILTADVSTYQDTKEWQFEHNDAGTRMNPPTVTKDLQHIFDVYMRRSMNHPENVSMPAITEEWPHHLYREGRSMDPTNASTPMPMPIRAEEQPCLPNIEKRPRLSWQDLPSNKADLNKLVLWLDRHDGEWLGDALWPRYAKVAKVVYSNRSLLIKDQNRTSKGVIKDTNFYPEEEPPIPYNILPAMQPCDEIDRLSALPHDVRVEILSYLLLPNFQMRMGDPEMVEHTLNSVALVSRAWRDQVDAFCGHALLVWKQRVRRSEASMFWALHDEPDSWVEWRALKSYTSCTRMEYVFRTRTCCVLCGTTQKCLELSASLGMIWCAQCRDPELNPQDSDDDAVRYR